MSLSKFDDSFHSWDLQETKCHLQTNCGIHFLKCSKCGLERYPQAEQGCWHYWIYKSTKDSLETYTEEPPECTPL